MNVLVKIAICGGNDLIKQTGCFALEPVLFLTARTAQSVQQLYLRSSSEIYSMTLCSGGFVVPPLDNHPQSKFPGY